jgi:hypothetical protein
MPAHPSSFFRPALLAPGLFAVALLLAFAPHARAVSGASAPTPAAPKITEQPASVTLYQGETLTLRVTAEGYTSPGFQWRKNGQNLPGATGDTFTVANAQPADSGHYEVVASNKVGRVTSESAQVLVVASHLPLVLRAPFSQAVPLGGTARFELIAAGSPFPAYQWRKDGRPLPGATHAVLEISPVQASDEGAYDVLLTNTRGSVLSPAATLSMLGNSAPATPASPAGPATSGPAPSPAIGASPAVSPAAPGPTAPGTPVTFSVPARGADSTFQWQRHGRPLPGATDRTLTLPAVTAADMGCYSVVIRDAAGTTESDYSILTVAVPGDSRLVNLSTRGYVPVGGSLTPGFSWGGPAPKNLLIRAVGPTLARFGVGGTLAHPRLALTPVGAPAPVATNDGWSFAPDRAALAAVTAATGAFPLDPDSADSALLATLAPDAPRNHTVSITSSDTDAAGTTLAEIYDADPGTSPSRLTAVSVLGLTGPGDRALTAGFTLSGPAPRRLLLRAVGPGLAWFGVTETLPNPRLLLHTAGLTRPIASNDDWTDTPDLAAAHASAGAFALTRGSRDSALVVTLPPGNYTVSVDDATAAPGRALVEIYVLED